MGTDPASRSHYLVADHGRPPGEALGAARFSSERGAGPVGRPDTRRTQVDYVNLYKPAVVDDILAGIVFEFGISQTFPVVALALVGIPALMILLSTILPVRASRITNLVAASLYVPVSMVNSAGGRGSRVIDRLRGALVLRRPSRTETVSCRQRSRRSHPSDAP